MCDHDREPEATPELPPSADVLAVLVDNHRAFLAFVERRVGDRALAEDILQTAFVKCADKLETVRESAVGWFYRVLRNAIIDHRRRAVTAGKRLERYTHAATTSTADDDHELRSVVCKCVGDLARTLKPEYADALRQVELEGISVKDYADRAGISASNAGVRVFRARAALRKQVVRSCGTCAAHGCLDCTCGREARVP